LEFHLWEYRGAWDILEKYEIIIYSIHVSCPYIIALAIHYIDTTYFH